MSFMSKEDFQKMRNCNVSVDKIHSSGKETKSGRFHRWADVIEWVGDVQVIVTKGIVETIDDGKIHLFNPTDIRFSAG
jgi:hypothetical protein